MSACRTAEPPDLILTNGHIVTVNPDQPEAEAVAIRGARIIAVGDSEIIDKMRGEQTEVIDLAGKTMVPGLVDGHLHFPGLGADRSRSI